MKNNTKQTALASLLAALSACLIIAGSLLDIFDLTVCAVCSVIIVISMVELKGKYPFLVFFASSMLSFIFMPMSTAAIYYTGFFGWYPIAKKHIVRIKKPFSKLLSFCLFNLCIGAIWLIFSNLFISESDTLSLYVVLFITGNIFFAAFDYVLDVFPILYKYKFRKMFTGKK